MGHNERLEFFGDSMVRTVIDDCLLERHPKYNEDQLSEARDALVSKHGFLSKSAEKIGLGPFIVMGTGERHNFNGTGRKKILADTMEAIIAAVFIDSGKKYDVIHRFIAFHAGFKPKPDCSLTSSSSILPVSSPTKSAPEQKRSSYDTTIHLPRVVKQVDLDTQLLKAVEISDLKEVNHLLAQGANPNTVHTLSYTISCPLSCSLEAGICFVEILNYANKANTLELAIRKTHSFTENTVPIVRSLLEYKADPNANNITDITHSLLQETIMYYSKRRDGAKPIFKQLTQLLCEHKADVHAQVTISTHISSMRVNTLQLAIIFNDPEKVDMLLRHRAKPNELNSHGQTALHVAALWADHHITWEKSYMRLKLHDPLHSSSLISYSAIIQSILAYGGDAIVRDQSKKQARDLTQEPYLQELLSPSIEHKHTETPSV